MSTNMRLGTALSGMFLVAVASHASAQIGVVDDVLRAVSKASKAGKVTKAGRLATSMTDDAGRVLGRVSASAATRQRFGLGLAVVATDAFESAPPVAGRLRVYLGLADSKLTYVPESNPKLWDVSKVPEGATLDAYVRGIRASGQKLDGIDYVVEADAFRRPALPFRSGDRVFLANYGGQPWRIREFGANGYAAEVTPSLWLTVSEDAIDDVKHLLDLAFDPNDVRVASLFDLEADGESVGALRKAAATTTYKNIETAEDALSFVRAKRGQIVALVGHVEDQHFVVQGLTSEKFRVSISSLMDAAERRGVSLLILGCDTAEIQAGAGLAGRVNSVALASQLHDALHVTTYSDFLSALGSTANPLVASRDVLGQARVIVATRLRREARGDRAGVVSVHASPKLAQLQTNNAAQTFRSVPPWVDGTLSAAMGLAFWAFLIAFIVSIFKRSLSPVKTTGRVFLGLALSPFAAVRWFVGRLRHPRPAAS